MMDVEETAKQIRQVLTLLLEGGFVMPIILASIDRFGSIVVAVHAYVRQEGSLALRDVGRAHEERAF
jgi:hypothetical protein